MPERRRVISERPHEKGGGEAGGMRPKLSSFRKTCRPNLDLHEREGGG